MTAWIPDRASPAEAETFRRTSKKPCRGRVRTAERDVTGWQIAAMIAAMIRTRLDHALVLFSGGQDSATCLPGRCGATPMSRPSAFAMASVTPSNWPAAEPLRAALASPCLGPDHIVDLTAAISGLGTTALTSDAAITMTDEGLPNTFVPGRNLLFLTCAAALAFRRGLRRIVAGMCETDYSGYPDCRDDTVKAMQLALNLGMNRRFVLETPLMWRDKAATWELARDPGRRGSGGNDPRRDA